MLATINVNNSRLTVDLSKPLDISIVMSDSSQNPLAWYLEKPQIYPVQLGDWVGKVSQGAAVNFNSISFNPHAHGTHTECLGHITKAFYSVNDALKSFFFMAEVITISPVLIEEDYLLSLAAITQKLKGKTPKAVVIRTLPNTISNKSKC